MLQPLIQRLVRRLQGAHPDHHAIARAMARVMLFVLLGSVARIAKEVAIAYRYGAGAEVDAYLFVFTLVTWPVTVWFGVLTVVLLPLVARVRHRAAGDLPLFRSELFGATLLLGGLLASIGWFGLPVVLDSTLAGLPETTRAIANGMVPGMALLAPLGVVISLFSVWMMSSGQHANTLFESIPALVIFLVLVLFPGGAFEPLVWGTLAGFVFQLVALSGPLAARGDVGSPRLSRRSPEWTPFLQGFGIMLAGQALMALTAMVDQFFAAHLPTGSIAALGYANRILALILGVGAMAVSRATLPVFSRARAQGDHRIDAVAMHWARLLLLLGFAALVLAWWLAPLIVRLMFERGAFGAGDTAAVVEVLRTMLGQLPFYFAGLVFVSHLSSRSSYGWLLWSGIIGLSVKLLGNVMLVPYFGLGGIAFSTVLMYAVNTLFFYWVFRVITRGG